MSDLGWIDNPNTTPTKDYEKASGGVPPRYQRGFAYGEGGCFYTKGMMQMQTEDTPNVQE